MSENEDMELLGENNIQYILQDSSSQINEEDYLGNEVIYSDGTRAILVQGTDGQFFIPANSKFILSEDGSLLIDQDNSLLGENGEFLQGTSEEIENKDDEEQIIYLTDSNEALVEGDDIGMTAFQLTNNGVEIEALESTPDCLMVMGDESQNFEENYQHYAILKDGKLHIQMYDTNSLEMLNFVTENNEEVERNVDFSKITGRNLYTGQTVSLESYMAKIKGDLSGMNVEASEEELEEEEEDGETYENNTAEDELLHKKLVLGMTSTGKKLVGRILKIERRTGSIENDKSEPVVMSQNEPNILIKKHVISRQKFDYISKTLSGLMEMDSIQKKLNGKNVLVKLIEKTPNKDSDFVKKNVSYLYGHTEFDGNKWSFELLNDDQENNENKYVETTSLTLIMTTDRTGKRTTRINLSPYTSENGTCTICGKTFKNGALLKRHITNYHMAKKQQEVKCNVCNKVFSNKRSLRRHRNTTHEPSIQCSLCPLKFPYRSSLNKHLTVHTGIETFQCWLCSRSFSSFADLNFHQRTHAAPMKQYVCDVCGREFSRHSNLQRHLEIHKAATGGGTLYRCKICSCSYNYMSSLTRHVVQNHINKEWQVPELTGEEAAEVA